LNYLGNLFDNSNSNNSPTANFVNSNQMIFGKYFISDKKAYRASARIGLSSWSTLSRVADMAPGADPDATVENKLTVTNRTLGLAFGIEHRKGNRRLQGIYGYEAAFLWTNGGKTSYSYGNHVEYEDSGYFRPTIIHGSSQLSLSLRGFVGAEYFFAPKISMGLEFGWGLKVAKTGQSSTTVEGYNKQTSELITLKTVTSTNGNSFIMDTDNLGGALKLLLYF
jgi:hypothetical protein